MCEQNQSSWIKEYSFKRFEINSFNLQHSPHIREFHILISIKSGLARFYYGEQTKTLCAGQSIILRAGELLSLTPISTSTFMYLHHIDPIDVIEANDGQLLPNTEVLLAKMNIINDYANRLFNPIENKLTRNAYLTWLRGLVSDLNKHNPCKNLIRLSSKHIERIASVRTYILDGLDCPYDLNLLSKEFQVDKWNLSKSIRPILGLTLQQQYHAAKVAQARKMLSNNESVTEVAYHLDYSDQSHFIRFFKSYTGTTPKKWSHYAISRQNINCSTHQSCSEIN